MRRRVIGQLLDLFRPAKRKQVRSERKTTTKSTTTTGAPTGTTTTTTTKTVEVVIEYTPRMDGDPDPGEVVWTWVPYEDDPNQGKDRPVVVIGRRGKHLAAVALTSKRHDNELQVPVGTGPWDREGRQSYAKVERVLDVVAADVRREGAVLERKHFDDVVEGVRRAHP